MQLHEQFVYSAFEVPCPNRDLKSALDHVARDVVTSHYAYTVRARLGESGMNPSNLLEQLFDCESPVSGNYTSMYSSVCQLMLV